ncbi:unnamed protein product [Urochloa humidicola]
MSVWLPAFASGMERAERRRRPTRREARRIHAVAGRDSREGEERRDLHGGLPPLCAVAGFTDCWGQPRHDRPWLLLSTDAGEDHGHGRLLVRADREVPVATLCVRLGRVTPPVRAPGVHERRFRGRRRPRRDAPARPRHRRAQVAPSRRGAPTCRPRRGPPGPPPLRRGPARSGGRSWQIEGSSGRSRIERGSRDESRYEVVGGAGGGRPGDAGGGGWRGAGGGRETSVSMRKRGDGVGATSIGREGENDSFHRRSSGSTPSFASPLVVYSPVFGAFTSLEKLARLGELFSFWSF